MDDDPFECLLFLMTVDNLILHISLCKQCLVSEGFEQSKTLCRGTKQQVLQTSIMNEKKNIEKKTQFLRELTNNIYFQR